MQTLGCIKMHLSQEGYCALMALFRLIEPKFQLAVLSVLTGIVVTACHVRVVSDVTADCC